MIEQAKKSADIVDVDAFSEMRDKGALVIDVREPGEWQKGHVEDAAAIPRGTLEMKITEVVSDQQRPVVTYCAGGGRAALAAATLQSMGYTAAVASEAGFDDLKAAGLPCSEGD